VTVTEFADLECPVCRAFALGSERQLISHEVADGRVKLVYRSLCTATCAGPLGHAGFAGQQSAAYAAGVQNRAWYYIELFYEEQGGENSGYVTPRYLDGLAQQLSGLDYRRWSSDRGLAPMRRQVAADERAARARGFADTPTIVIRGPRGSAQPIVGDPSYGQLRAAIASVQ
jgi:protein-disulfide isomerase